MPEARLGDSGSGLAPAGDGWFVVNLRDAEWWTSDTTGKRPRGSMCEFESQKFEFPQLGFRLHVLEPSEPSGLYHSESDQEAFLVLSGECRLLVEGEERLLRPWDRGGGDVRPEAGVRGFRVVSARAALVLGPPALGPAEGLVRSRAGIARVSLA